MTGVLSSSRNDGVAEEAPEPVEELIEWNGGS